MIPEPDLDGTPERQPTPCAEWAPLLAAGARDVAPAERAALERHVAGCAACRAARAAYARMDGLIHGLPTPAALPALPPRLLAAWRAEDAARVSGRATPGRRSSAVEEVVLDDLFISDDGNEGMRTMPTSNTPGTDSVTTAPPAPRAPRPRRKVTAWLGGTAAVAVVALFALAFALLPHGGVGPGVGPGARPGAGQATATGHATPTMLPTNGLSLAYLAQDGHLHYTGGIGPRETTGLALPDTAWISQPGNDDGPLAIAAPDGSAIAYAGGTGAQASTEVVIVKLASGTITRVRMPATGGQSEVRAANLFWSPDGRQIAVDPYFEGNTGPISLIDVATGAAHVLPNTSQVDRIAGWLDASHLAVIANFSASKAPPQPQGRIPASGQMLALPFSGGPALEVDALDISGGALRHIVDLATNAPPDVFVSPDGKLIYVAPSTWVGTGYVVDPTTGATRDLPHISNTFTDRFTNIGNDGFAKGGNWAVPMAWNPGTHTVAMSLGAFGPGTEGGPAVAVQSAGVWVLDLDHDTATEVTANVYPLAWQADGNTLLVSNTPPSSAAFSAQNGGLMAGPVVSILSSPTPGAGVKEAVQDLVVPFGLAKAG
jgi:hypothetical protein